MGTVHKARDLRLGRLVALKRLLTRMAGSRIALKRFMTEAKSVAALNHPNIVQIYDIGCDRYGYFISMELVEGGTLQDKICHERRLDTRAAAQITCELAEALHVAHKRGIIHRDIKPANVLLTRKGVPKLTDFGLARRIEISHRTVAGALLGTIEFVAPEQRADASKADARSDLYSLVGMLYYMITGTVPLVVRSELIPANIRPVVLKGLEQDPERRYRSCEEFAEALEAAASGKAFPDEPSASTPGLCPNCGFENGLDRKFCARCGFVLVEKCFHCGDNNPVGTRYCGNCRCDLEARRREIAKRLAHLTEEARELQRQQRFGEALGKLSQVAAVSHTAFERYVEEARELAEKIGREKSEVEHQYRQAWEQLKRLFQTCRFRQVLTLVRGYPPVLRGGPIAQLAQRAQQALARIAQLNAELKSAVSQKNLADILRLATELHPLQPHRQDLRQAITQIRGRLEREQVQARLQDQQAQGESSVSTPRPTPPSDAGGDVRAPTPPASAVRRWDSPVRSAVRRPVTWIAGAAIVLVVVVTSLLATNREPSRVLSPDASRRFVSLRATHPENMVRVGQRLTVGDLDLKVEQITRDRVCLEWRPAPGRSEYYRRAAESALTLHLALTNTGKAALRPLDLALLLKSPNQHIQQPDGNRVRLYELPSGSDYQIHGQALGTIPPGGTLRTVLVAEDGAAQTCPGEHTWQLQLRCNSDGSTAVIGVRFSESDISKPKP